MMLLDLIALRILLDKPASLWHYLNDSIFLHPSSNTSEAKETANSIPEAPVC